LPKKRYARAYVEITNVCNRNCSFCPGTKREKARMSLSDFSFVAEKLVQLTDYVYLHVMGEPLTHPELCDIIRCAKDNGLKCAITTNGTLLDKVGDKIIAAKPYKVNISLHSFENGSDEEYISYIKKCYSFADKASKGGILTVVRLWNRGFDEGRNINTLDMLKACFASDEWVLGSRGARIRDKLHLEYGDRFDWPDLNASYLGDDVFCHGLGDHFGILCDGTVVPCCLDREGAIALGNALREDLCDVLSSPLAQSIREGFARKKAVCELCKRCGYARRFKL